MCFPRPQKVAGKLCVHKLVHLSEQRSPLPDQSELFRPADFCAQKGRARRCRLCQGKIAQIVYNSTDGARAHLDDPLADRSTNCCSVRSASRYVDRPTLPADLGVTGMLDGSIDPHRGLQSRLARSPGA